jgi:hypothetical protein
MMPNPNQPSAQASMTGSGSSFPAVIGQWLPVVIASIERKKAAL